MKTYYNDRERKAVTVAIMSNAMMTDMVSVHMSKDERKYLKMSISFFQKFLTESLKRVGPAEGKNIVKIASKSVMMVVPPKEVPNVPFAAMDIHILAPGVIEAYCRNCNKDAVKIKECDILNLFKRANVPTADRHKECEYKY